MDGTANRRASDGYEIDKIFSHNADRVVTVGSRRALSAERTAARSEYCSGPWRVGRGWKGVYDILVKDGYDVSVVQEPETSFKEDVAATKRILAQQDGQCILVGHSYGGAVITEAGTEFPGRFDRHSESVGSAIEYAPSEGCDQSALTAHRSRNTKVISVK